ncbi:hypothetical protein HZC00_03980 [Candidatus Kaiserbacteria bacterium]|nr:hypothetical protein [Candidatus Kaiserbacteria bacterium]
MNLVAMQIAESRRKIKMTILYRAGGVWHKSEIGKLANGLVTEVSQLPEHPEHLVVFGHHTKEETLRALGRGVAYTVTQVVGIYQKDLPFVPGFA